MTAPSGRKSEKSRGKIDASTVQADFNDLTAVLHYTKAAHELGLWASERLMIDRYFLDRGARLLELGCGAGRVSIAMWGLGYSRLTGIDFAGQLIDQAKALASERGATSLAFRHADATALPADLSREPFEGVLFLFNGLMQIPGRDNRRMALREARRVCKAGSPLLFTTHDREDSRIERSLWRLESTRWSMGMQDPRLVEFGDRYFEDEAGRTFMHLPTRSEILEDLEATGWTHVFDEMRRRLAKESKPVRDFSDECRFWVATA
ncbi:MAG TPA: class I SAM-dependent methyltransferase [Opitutaceae bacterium]|nr:class I SAM-dependent methyltransferase [Opitutaceae bacterium]